MRKMLAGVLFVAGIFALSNGFAEEVVPVAAPAVAPAVAEKSLFERLGGEAGIRAVVDNFVPRAAANPAVNFTRVGHKRTWEATPENVETLKKHLTAFIGTATGGNTNYAGRDMKAAHQDMGITSAEFDAIAADLLASLKELNVPEKETNELMAIAATTKGAIVEAEAATETKTA